MTDERWNEVKRLFEVASSLQVEHREVVLDALDPTLHKEVESLLAAEEESFLEQEIGPPRARSPFWSADGRELFSQASRFSS